MTDDSELIVVTVEDKQVLTRDVVERSIVFGGEQGPPGPAGPTGPPGPTGAASVEVAFAFGDATPTPVVTALAGKLVYVVELYVKVPFDGTGAQVTIGDAAQLDRLMSATENDLSAVGGNHSTPVHAYGSDTPILLSITPGAGATQGSGVLVLRIQQ